MRKIIILFSLLILFGCSEDNNETSELNEIPNELTEININIELPENSQISPDDLSVSSLFTEISQSTVLTFNDESIELAFARNSEDNIVLLSYFNPMDGTEITMNSETTAIAMIMLHPWTMDLSITAKEEAIAYIKTIPEFLPYKESIESGISSGTLDPLNSTEIFDAISQIQNIIFQRNQQPSEALQFNIVNNSVAITNALSSATYDIGLYNENNELVEHKLSKGIEKTHFFLSDFASGIYQETPIEQNTATFNIPLDGSYELRARNGFAFDASTEDRNAAYENCSKLTFSLIGVLSTKLKKALEALNSGNCAYNVGEFLWNGTSGSINIAETFQNYSNNTISGYQLLINLGSFLSNRTEGLIGVIDNCIDNPSDGLNFLNNNVLRKTLSFFNILVNIGDAFNSAALLTDMIIYDSTVDYCVVKNGNEISQCLVPFYLASNGVTIKANAGVPIGTTGELNGIQYTLVDNILLDYFISSGEDLSRVVTSGVTNMVDIFDNYPNFNQDISTWDTSNVVSMQAMFDHASAFNQDISAWDVSNVSDMARMFYYASAFNQDISAWDVSNVSYMNTMFSNASAFNQEISAWDVSNVFVMNRMFSNASAFNQDISAWDVSNVSSMSNMFSNASTFNQNISNWNVSQVTLCTNFSTNSNENWAQSDKPNFTNCNPN